MRLVVDTNILLSALLTDSATRRLFVLGKHDLYYPIEALRELEMCERAFIKRGRVDEDEFNRVKEKLLRGVQLISVKNFPEVRKVATKIMQTIDSEDAMFVAVALIVPDCKIWSNDKHLKAQRRVEVVSTEDLLS